MENHIKYNEKAAFWSRFAKDFDNLQKRVVGEEIINLVLNELRKEKGLKKVLELGCGTGYFTKALLNNTEHITATDFCEEMIAEAVKLYGRQDKILFETADATCLQYEDCSFDTVFMANLIHLVDDPVKTIQESYRVLKDNGRILITSFTVDDMDRDNRTRIISDFISTFGIPPRGENRPKTASLEDIVNLLVSNRFSIIKSIVLGNDVKASYVIGKPLSDRHPVSAQI